MKGEDPDPGRQLFRGEHGLDPADLAGPGKKNEDVPGVLGEGFANRCRDGRLGSLRRMRDPVPGIDREDPAGCGDDRCAPQHGRHLAGVDRRRHDQHPKIRAKDSPRLEHQRQTEVGVQTPLVKLVENDQAVRFERGIVLQQPREDALGHHFDPGFPRNPGVETDSIAHGPADRFTQMPGNPASRRPSREATGLQHDDLPTLEPGLVQ